MKINNQIKEKEFKGKIVFQRNKWRKDKCYCCKSHRHIYSRYIDFPEKDFIMNLLKRVSDKNENEGKIVKLKVIITLENENK